MAVIDHQLGAYQALKGLVLTDTWFADVQGKPNAANGVRSLVWLDGADPQPTIRKPSKAPADLLELTLDWASGSDDGRQGAGRNGTPTFGNQQPGACKFVGTETAEFEWVLVSPDSRVTPATAVVARLLYLLNGSPALSVGAGASGEPGRSSWRSEITNRGPAAGGSMRRVVRVRTPVIITYRGPATA